MSVTNGSIKKIYTLLNAKRKGILVNTFEENRFEEDMKTVANAKGFGLISWSLTEGFVDVLDEGAMPKPCPDIDKMLTTINNQTNDTVYLLKDIHDIWKNPRAKRHIRDILEKSSQAKAYTPLVFISPVIDIPMELERLIALYTYELPTEEEIVEQLEGMISFLQMNNLEVPNERDRVATINALKGLTLSEIANALKESVVETKKISTEYIVALKEQTIKKTGLLQYITKLGNMNNVGGFDLLKDWLDDARFAFDVDTEKYKIKSAKGVILAGFPGVGKSVLAKSIAYDWNLPLLKMSMSDIMGSHVGESEKNVTRAMKLAESVSPCILWIDELEKALAGGDQSSSDGGTTSRVISELLTWLADKEKPVFVLGTANDLTQTKDELTRAGRFDEIFFLSVPSVNERMDILQIHLEKHGYEIKQTATETNHITDVDLVRIVAEMEDFSGAEIEQVVVSAARRAHAKFCKGERSEHWATPEEFEQQAKELVPLAKRNPMLLPSLRDWALRSAKFASSAERDIVTKNTSIESIKRGPSSALTIDLD